MNEKSIVCYDCGESYQKDKRVFRCLKCSGSLDIIFDYKKIKKSISRETLLRREFNHLRYKEFYPVKNPLSIQEGGTPLLRSRNLERELKLGFELYFKNEAQNPSGSFKDRGSSVEIAKALEFRAKKLVCASTGNMGASVASYSGIANLDCSILVPSDTVSVKIEQILAYGAKVYQVPGDYTKAAKLAESLYREKGYHLLGDYLYRREGTKSVGFEIAEQTKADYVFCPIGNGTLISAIWKSFKEFEIMNFINKKPKLVGIQAKGCNPIVRAFEENSEIKPLKNPKTIAIAIECGNPLDGKRALDSIRESKGFAESVTDKEILKVREMLAKREGLFAEPAGAASLAGLLKSKNQIERGSRVVCLVTGHGLKTPFTGVKGKTKKMKSL